MIAFRDPSWAPSAIDDGAGSRWRRSDGERDDGVGGSRPRHPKTEAAEARWIRQSSQTACRMIEGGNWCRANEIVIRYLTHRTRPATIPVTMPTIELGEGDLGVGVDEGLLVDAPNPLHVADLEDVLSSAIAGAIALEFAMRLLLALMAFSNAANWLSVSTRPS
jgi:hypothetical protein